MNLNWVRFSSILLIVISRISAAPEALPRSSPEAQGISSAAILLFLDRAESEIDAIHSFMLLRHGHVVAEGWWAPYGPERLHVLHSLSKSFTSTAVGFAVDEGRLDLDDTVISFFPDDVPEDPSDHLAMMRIRQLLNMTAGQEKSVNFRETDNWVKAFLESDIEHKPGTHWVYNSSASFMLSAIVQKATGETVFDYLTPRLFEPLGMEGARWDTNPQGINTGGWGLYVRTRDIASLGQLYLQKGDWKGKQLLSRDWIEEATTKQASNGCVPDSDWDQGYGYQFWMCRHGLYRGDGAHGQFCIVFPEQDAVLAITSGVGDMGAVMRLVWDELLPAMGEGPLVENPVLTEILEQRLGSLELPAVVGEATSPQMADIAGGVYRVEENPAGILSVSLEREGGDIVMVLETATGRHRFRNGYGHWYEGITHFMPDAGPVPIATSGAWTDESTYTSRSYQVEQASCNTAVLRFAGDALELSLKQNVGWGPSEAGPLKGVRIDD